ncbi:MAG: hypothetical protein U0838_06805 [Chloroflexota bacterium]
MTRKRKVTYPPPRSSKGPAPAPVPYVTPPTVAVINMQATTGKSSIEVGMRVLIQGTGLYTGEIAVVESLVGGVIPAAAVRTEAGRTRRVRTIDLVPAPPKPKPAAAEEAGEA